MNIRPARAADAPGILAIWNPIIRDTLVTFTHAEKTAADIAALVDRHATPGHVLFVADAAGQVAGFAGYAPFRSGPGYLRTLELTVHVHPEARGQGVGRRLVEALTDAAGAEAAGSLWAGISGANPDALAFHGRMGFRAGAVLPRVGFKAGRWLDLHLMVKWLPASGMPPDRDTRQS